MTKQEQGRRCGFARAHAERVKARSRGRRAVDYADEAARSALMAMLDAGHLDRFVQQLEFGGYKRGYNKRDERVRRLAKAHAARAGEQAA